MSSGCGAVKRKEWIRTHHFDRDGHRVCIHEEAYERHPEGQGVNKRGVHDEVEDGNDRAAKLPWNDVRVELPEPKAEQC